MKTKSFLQEIGSRVVLTSVAILVAVPIIVGMCLPSLLHKVARGTGEQVSERTVDTAYPMN